MFTATINGIEIVSENQTAFEAAVKVALGMGAPEKATPTPEKSADKAPERACKGHNVDGAPCGNRGWSVMDNGYCAAHQPQGGRTYKARKVSKAGLIEFVKAGKAGTVRFDHIPRAKNQRTPVNTIIWSAWKFSSKPGLGRLIFTNRTDPSRKLHIDWRDGYTKCRIS